MLLLRDFGRRGLMGLGLAAALLVTACGGGGSPETALRIGFTSTETDPSVVRGFEAFEAFLEEQLQVPVELYNASDYAGVAQAMEAGQVDVAFVGPSNYAGMHLSMGDRVRPILVPKGAEYISVLFVRADSPYQTIDDLAGKSLAFADVNSTSGYLVPTFYLSKEGKDPNTFFGQTLFAGGHAQAVVAVLGGQADAGATWSSIDGDPAQGYARGNFRQMVDAGRLNMADVRVIWRSGPIPPGPVVASSALDPDLGARFIALMKSLHETQPEMFAALVGGEADGYIDASHELFVDVVEMRKAEEAARRER